MADAKKTVMQAIDEIWNRGDLDAIDRYFVDDYVSHDPVADTLRRKGERRDYRRELREEIEVLRGTLPDLRYSIDDAVAEGNKVVTRWTATGTHSGEVGKTPATREEVVISGMTSCELNARGQIVESFTHSDIMLSMQRLGVAPQDVALSS